jgi:uncharacterized protein
LSRTSSKVARSASYRRAKLRHLFLTTAPDRLSFGKLKRRHLDQPVHVRELQVESPHWPRALNGLRIGHLSDLHVGNLMPVERARVVIDTLKRQAPDLVACTGDVVDLELRDARPVLDDLAAVDAPLGEFLVLGNHDYLDDGDLLAEFAAKAGLNVLRDSTALASDGTRKVRVSGVDWAKTARECAARVSRVAHRADLLLSHNPRAFAAAVRMGVPLTLAGHTHGGQIALPKRPRANLAMSHRHRAGMYEQDGSHLYVTSGVGAWFPLRVNCPPEIAIITMNRSS